MTMPHALPADWQDVVARVSDWLDDQSAQLDRRENAFLLRFPLTEAPLTDSSPLEGRIRALPAQLTPLESIVHVADAATGEPETALRDLARASESLRLRLADWVGRAIG
jgi:hypothetical protein